jgi:hypothetical protein
MVNVRFVSPGSRILETMSKDAYFLPSSAREDFLNEIEDISRRRGRPWFIATEEDCFLSIGLTSLHQVTSLRGEEALLSDSHARHRVRRGADLIPSLKVGGWYTMALDPASGEILAAYESAPQWKAAQPASRYPIDPCDLPSISRSKAEDFFSSVSLQPHIPFQYPLNGCWARAHEIVRLIERYFDCDPRTIVAKIWNFGSLEAKTNNNPHCRVQWDYHVAPIVKVDAELLVIDPSLFNQPVSVDIWRQRQSDLSKKPAFTSLDAYDWNDHLLFIGERPGQTEKDLSLYRGQLFSLIYCRGPLPYRCHL